MDDTTRGVGDETTRNYASGEGATRGIESTGTTRSAPRSRTRATKTATASSSELAQDPETERRTRQIEAEIQHTREEMAETVEALQERLRPSNVIAEATDRVKTATTAKVKNMAETASDTAQDIMSETRQRAYDVVEGARQNPIPALMIGAGVAWLLMGKNKGTNRDNDYSSQYRSSAFRSRDYYQPSDEPVYSDVEDRPSRLRNEQDLASRARTAADRGLDTARRTTYRAQNQLERMMREHPLLVGAAAVVVGAAVGAALPETERENELMGEARESVVNRAQDAARSAASTVQSVAKDAADEVAERVVSDTVGATGTSTTGGKTGSTGTSGL